MREKGYLFVFEGPDGVGKTTLAEATVAYLNKHDIPCEYLAFPGQKPGTLGHHIYDLHHSKTHLDANAFAPTSLQVLHIAAHIDAIENQIRPLLASGTSIVLDRYWWSTLVYGSVYKANMEALSKIVEGEIAYWGEEKPDHIFMIRRPKPVEHDFNGTWIRLMETYDRLFEERVDESPATVIDNSGAINSALHKITNTIGVILDCSYTLSGKTNKKAPNIEASTKSKSLQSPHVSLSLTPATPTEVYNTYWYFAAARQKIFFARFQGEPPPWTDDPILGTYKFTNAYRASDRVSQYLIRHVIYEGDKNVEELFFRILLFKIFNKISTWELLRETLGEIRYDDYSYERYDQIITGAMSEGKSVFSAAYIMPSGTSSFGERKKHRNYLRLLDKLMRENVPHRIVGMKKMRDAFELLLSYPSIGQFLAYQLITDINYSCLTNFSEVEFVMPGPGAKSGIRKCFTSTGGLNDADIIRLVSDRQDAEFEVRGIDFHSLWGRRLQLIDCQNLFCEVDKYARIAHPTIAGIGKRTRIKHKFEATRNLPIDYWYPPKWGLNDKIFEAKRKFHEIHRTIRK